MKPYILLSFVSLFSLIVSSQNLELEKKIAFVKSKIQQTEKGERLKWLDSLTELSYREAKLFKHDSIAKETIKYAISLDSLNFAAGSVGDLMGYYNNYVGTPKEALSLFNHYFETLKKGSSFNNIGRMTLNAADSYFYTGNIDKSLEFYEQTKVYASKAKNEKLRGLAILYTGDTESVMGKFSEASVNLKEASQIITKLKDTFNILAAKNALAILYSKNAFYEEAQKEREEAIVLAKKKNSNTSLRNLYRNSAEDNERTGDAKNQIANLKKSLLANSKLKNAFFIRPSLLTALVVAYAENDSLNLAEEHFKEIEANYLNDKTDKNRGYYVLAKKAIYFGKKDYTDAIKYGLEYLEYRKQRNGYEEVMMTEKFLGKVYKYNNDIINSNKHYLNYYTINDSLSSIQKLKSLAYYQTLYETEKRDHKIENQQASIGLLNLQNKSKTQFLIFGSLGLLGLFGGVIFYRSFLSTKKKALMQQAFSQELIKTQEQERTRIAKDLHDGVGQQITLLKMKAQNLDQVELSLLANSALEEVRSVSRDLYPVTLAKLGLTESVEQLLFDLDEETDLFISVEIDNVNHIFGEAESLNFYRFIQESVNNVLKHAHAKTLIVNVLKHSDGIKILIKDNGQGFEVSKMIKKNSLGLKTMAERVSMLKGNLSIRSKSQEGTSILVQIPV